MKEPEITKNPLLPFDYCRCMGSNCEVKVTCLRYAARNDVGYRIPFTSQLCDDQHESFIPMTEVK